MTLKSFLLGLCFVTVWPRENHAYIVSKYKNVTKANPSSDENSTPYVFALLGATGDLSKRKIYPALWSLYRDKLLPKNTRIFGYANKKSTVEFLRKNCEPYVKVKSNERNLYNKFWQLNSYVNGSDGGLLDYEALNSAIEAFEKGEQSHRIFYMALPPVAFTNASSHIKTAAMAQNRSIRVVIEKPFGRDYRSSQKLSKHLSSIFSEDQIYRIDHYLGYEMMQNLLTLRFGNRMFESTWNKENIGAVKIDFAEKIGVEGRGKYFDDSGIIRDVMQNHLLQAMSLIAMEKPKSNDADDIRDAKVKLLRNTETIMNLSNIVLGQYVANPTSEDPEAKIGYLNEPTVPDDSITPTFALIVLRVKNKRWYGVPFIIRAGKGLNKTHTQITIQYKDIANGIFKTQPTRNELIVNLKNPQMLQVKLSSKIPGFSNDIQDITIDYNYSQVNKNVTIPEPYERLILNIFQGSQLNFVRSDELREAWRIFTPILHLSEQLNIRPKEYLIGSNGPEAADYLEKRYNFFNNI